MDEDAVLIVYDEEDDWLLVRVEGSKELLGFVPKNYCEPFDAVDGVAVPDAADAEAEIEAQRAEEERARAAALQRELQRKDKVETWSVSQLDGKKKKKGTLGVGGGAIFFASESDKVGDELFTELTCTVSRQAVPDHGPDARRAVWRQGHCPDRLVPR